jgi:DNA mismatch repair protein MutS
MNFPSVLFVGPEDGANEDASGAPDFFVDLNLDQIIEGITAGKREYNLKPFFISP